MAFNPYYFLIGRQLAARSVDEARATQLAVLSSGMLNIPLNVGLAMTSVIAERETPAPTPAPGDGAAPPVEDKIEVPSVLGLSEANALAAFAEAGFDVDNGVVVNEVYSSADEEGKVIAQAPSAGSTIAAADPLLLVVGLGEAVTVPDVTTMHFDHAEALLGALGLAVEEAPADEGDHDGLCPGHVARQEPEAGDPGDPGIIVTLYIVPEAVIAGEGDEPIEEPVEA